MWAARRQNPGDAVLFGRGSRQPPGCLATRPPLIQHSSSWAEKAGVWAAAGWGGSWPCRPGCEAPSAPSSLAHIHGTVAYACKRRGGALGRAHSDRRVERRPAALAPGSGVCKRWVDGMIATGGCREERGSSTTRSAAMQAARRAVHGASSSFQAIGNVRTSYQVVATAGSRPSCEQTANGARRGLPAARSRRSRVRFVHRWLLRACSVRWLPAQPLVRLFHLLPLRCCPAG